MPPACGEVPTSGVERRGRVDEQRHADFGQVLYRLAVEGLVDGQSHFERVFASMLSGCGSGGEYLRYPRGDFGPWVVDANPAVVARRASQSGF